MELLRFMPGIELLAVSRYRETRPIGGPANQGAYLNGACLVETELPPHQLLGTLCAVANTLDRQRDRPPAGVGGRGARQRGGRGGGGRR